MADTLDPLIDDLLEWIGSGRPYAEVMDAWRTSCPKLPVWEEANLRGYLSCRRDAAGVAQVTLTAQGRERVRVGRARAGAGVTASAPFRA
ncbi:MAG TPA: 3-phosphoglycerate dehydrogenase [Ramlibacter sp.]|nr:3-phosphoglycerate dehydrogenase [Ramlibacter sp.]